jgi:multidrug efflux system membrane fusion protein
VVTTAAALQKPMALNLRVVGNVEASSTVDIGSKVSGQLSRVGFAEGQEVAAGDVLFEIDPTPFKVAVEQAEAALARDTAQAKGAAMQLARSDDLLSRGLVAKSDHDAIATQVQAYQGTLAADQAMVDNARLQLTYTKIPAPVSGRTGALLVHPGSLVRANDASPLVVINQIAPIFVSFAVPARLLPQLTDERARGTLVVRAQPPGGPDVPPSTGSVTFVDNQVDQTTDTIRLKATFENKERRLWPGAFVDVIVQLAVNPRATVVPNAAVQVGQQGQYIYVLKSDQTVEPRPVVIAWTEGEESVIQSGIQPGDTVVTDGQLRLIPGLRVSVKPDTGGARP